MIYYILLLIINTFLFLIMRESNIKQQKKTNNIYKYEKIKKRNTKIYLILILSILLFMTTFRDINLGVNDTAKIHIPFFRNVRNMTFAEIFSKYTISNGILYALVAKFINYLTSDYRLFLCVSILPFLYGCYLLISNYSKMPFYSVTMLICLFYFISFTIMRQFFAMGFILIAFHYLLQKKPVAYILFNVLAIFTHFTSFVFLPTYFLYKIIDKGYINFFMILGCILVGLYFKEIIFDIIKTISPYYYFYLTVGVYSTKSSFSLIWFSVLIIFLLMAYFANCRPNNLFALSKKIRRLDKVLIYLLTIAIMLYCLSTVVGEFYRISFYFSMFSIILVPNTIAKINYKKLRHSVYYLSLPMLFVYLFGSVLVNYNCINYSFSF